MIHAATWVNLENIILSKQSQSPNTTYFMIQLYVMSKVGHRGQKTEQWLPRPGMERERWFRGVAWSLLMDVGLPLGMMNVF